MLRATPELLNHLSWRIHNEDVRRRQTVDRAGGPLALGRLYNEALRAEPGSVDADFEILNGLPATGPLPRWIPADWRRSGREGFVVRFRKAGGSEWTGNFRPGHHSCFEVFPHPSGMGYLVFAGGPTYHVESETEAAEELEMWASGVWPIQASADLLVEVSELAFLRLGAEGVVWHSRRVTWDGFANVQVDAQRVSGEAWSPIAEDLFPFSIDLVTGHTTGGAPDVPDSYPEMLSGSGPESS